ncbi:coilin [Fundulus diaphanus]
MVCFGVMAAHGNKYIRLRLLFDYPPPAAVGCRMCWLLVDLNTCRVVADLESIIREKFEFSRSSILSLFIEECYLPHTESIYVVRDNDNVRVKVECLAQVNGHGSCPETANVNRSKRRRDAGEDGPGNGPIIEHKKKKKKKLDSGTAHRSILAKVENKNKTPQTTNATKKKKKKKKAIKSVDDTHAAVPKATASSHKPPSPKKNPVGKTKKTKAPSSDSSSCSSDEDEACHKKGAKKPGVTPVASKEPLKPKAILKKPQPPSSSSCSDTDSSDEANGLKVPPKSKALSPATTNSKASQVQSAHCAQKQASSTEEPAHNPVMDPRIHDSEEEIQLVIRRPQQPVLNIPSQVPWRGPGKGKDKRWAAADPGERTGGTAHSDVQGFSNGTKEPSHHTDSLINKSLVFQNEAEQVPEKDYSSMPLLAGPPQVGQKIAFKLLELTENYTPEVSEYKEGKIVNFDPTTKQIELELLNASQAPAEPGKFDLVYQNPDGSESVEYAVQRGSSVMERWESLLEPRLII